MSDTNEQQTLLNFPEKFPIKIFGLEGDTFVDTVKRIIHQHVKEEDILQWHTNPSSKGKYLAITVTIMAQSQTQLDAIYLDLTASDCVKMAL